MSSIGILALATPRNGGTFVYTTAMIEALRRLEEHKYVLYTRRGSRDFHQFNLPTQFLPTRLDTIIGPLLSSRKSSGLFEEVDKIIAPVYSPYLLASRRPFAFTLHDLQERHYPQYFSWFRRLWRRTINSLLVRRAAFIVCESKFVKADIIRFTGARAEKVVIMAGPPISAFHSSVLTGQDLERVQTRLHLPQRFLFYPAQFWPHKNHLRLLRAFSSVVQDYPEFHLVLTGERRLECDKVLGLARDLGLAHKVLHLGHLDSKDVLALYALSTIVVIPTLFESISIPVYEAFATGVPICASNVFGLPEQIGDAGRLFDPLSSQDIARKIKELLGDGSLRKHLAEKGRQRLMEVIQEPYSEKLRDLLLKF